MPSHSVAVYSLITLPLAGRVASGAMAAVLMSRYGPGAYPWLPLQTGLLKSRHAVRKRAVPDESAAAPVRHAAPEDEQKPARQAGVAGHQPETVRS